MLGVGANQAELKTVFENWWIWVAIQLAIRRFLDFQHLRQNGYFVDEANICIVDSI
jgi:hypothetical protein